MDKSEDKTIKQFNLENIFESNLVYYLNAYVNMDIDLTLELFTELQKWIDSHRS